MSYKESNEMDDMLNRDGLLRISLMGGAARAFLMETTVMVEQARKLHNLSKTATAALGRTLTAASAMGAMLKGDKESVTASIQGDGPLGTVLAVAKADASVKGYVANPQVEVPRRGNKLDVGTAVGKTGKLTVVKDLRMKDPYVGQVNLVSGEIAEDFAMYFTASEQVPSLVSLGVLVSSTVEAAGGLIVQMMPGAGEAEIQSVENSAGMFMNISSVIQQDHLYGALEQLLMHLEPEVMEEMHPQYRCDCSRERVEKMLITLGEAELKDMIRTQHGAEVDCHFCNKRYRFAEQDLFHLLQSATNLEDA